MTDRFRNRNPVKERFRSLPVGTKTAVREGYSSERVKVEDVSGG